MKKLLSISAILVLLGVFLAADIGYAVPPKGDSDQAKKEAEKRLKGQNEKKKSAYHACATFIKEKMFKEGTEFTYAKFREIRKAYGGDISESMLRREIEDMLMLGLIERTSRGNYRIVTTMNGKQLEVIDTKFQEIGALAKPDKQKGRKGQNIGLNSGNIIGATSLEEQIQLKQIVGWVLLTGRAIHTADTDNPLNGMAHVNVVAITGGQVQGPRALTPEALLQKVGEIGPGRKLVIAIDRQLETVGTGEEERFTDDSQTYVTGVLEALKARGYKDTPSLYEREIIVFSHRIPTDILALIEGLPAEAVNTLNNLTPATVQTIVSQI